MKLAAARTLIVAAVALLTGTGCASAMQDTATATTPTAAAQLERRRLADGVELLVDPNAGPEAQRVAEMIQSEMRARYLGAR